MNIGHIALLLAFGLLGLGVWWLVQKRIADRDFERLLAGDDSIRLVAIEVEGQRKRVLLDPASVSYLSEMFRSAKRNAREFGLSYYMHARLSTGASITCGLNLPKKKDCLTLLFPTDGVGDGISYLVTLREPIPESLSEILSPLRSKKSADEKEERKEEEKVSGENGTSYLVGMPDDAQNARRRAKEVRRLGDVNPPGES